MTGSDPSAAIDQVWMNGVQLEAKKTRAPSGVHSGASAPQLPFQQSSGAARESGVVSARSPEEPSARAR